VRAEILGSVAQHLSEWEDAEGPAPAGILHLHLAACCCTSRTKFGFHTPQLFVKGVRFLWRQRAQGSGSEFIGAHTIP